MRRTTVEETRGVCTLCGGRGVEASYNTTAMTQTCRQCQGSGQVLIQTITRHEDVDVDAIAEAVIAKIRRLTNGD